MYFKTVTIEILGNKVDVNLSCTPNTPEDILIQRAYLKALSDVQSKLEKIEKMECSNLVNSIK
jgi:predicted aspartyl protease